MCAKGSAILDLQPPEGLTTEHQRANFDFLAQLNQQHHDKKAMTIWFAGGGVNAGHTIGATDETGAEAVEGIAHVRDVHVTILKLLGLEDHKLTYYHAGRFKQLSQFGGQVIKDLIAT